MEATSAGATVPMLKQETVKDDGRLLIYYSFPPEDAPQVDESPSQEASHV